MSIVVVPWKNHYFESKIQHDFSAKSTMPNLPTQACTHRKKIMELMKKKLLRKQGSKEKNRKKNKDNCSMSLFSKN